MLYTRYTFAQERTIYALQNLNLKLDETTVNSITTSFRQILQNLTESAILKLLDVISQNTNNNFIDKQKLQEYKRNLLIPILVSRPLNTMQC